MGDGKTISIPDKEKRAADSGPSVIIHCEQCKGCGRCITICPAGILVRSDNINSHGYTTTAVVTPSECKRCGLCFYTCPEPGAITVYRKRNDA